MDKRKPIINLKGSRTDVTQTVNLESDHNDPVSFVLGFLRNLVGVKDVFSLRISLPTHLLDSVSALEFWQYMDRPDLFVTLSDPDNDVMRFLGIVRWWFSKDSKWKDHVIKKPYNPILSEFFTCHWQVPNPSVSPASKERVSLASEPSTAITGNTTLSDESLVKPPLYTVYYLAEQISHHPPMSAYHFHCPEKDITAYGIDHLSGRFTGTAFRVGPGDQTTGIHVSLNLRNEEYTMTHPWAQVAGFLSGSLYITCGAECVITCPKNNLKCVIEYKEESMWSKPKFAIEGKLFRYDYSKDAGSAEKKQEKLSKVPQVDVLATLQGAWNGKVFYRLANDTTDHLLIDVQQSTVVEKIVRPIEVQAENESRRVWHGVTEALLKKDYVKANLEKRKIEDDQRAKAAENAKSGVVFEPAFFEVPQLGKPKLKDSVKLFSPDFSTMH
ncbi:hypothetical protein SeMB42_g02191 [Synchytrium endobioticum]|uniref:Oxysterol-binding protein n=1 Tax=Synchytrium endobioticum TaxID=286115 RepID=A0A507CJP1_9FUNG|nr:hypothetical protein SeLEV6574_g06926 [Synchytrium endobioticum]TPX50577.1 hypothetical protein SeMB42_g02191 [Synchytrium endobioticum]